MMGDVPMILYWKERPASELSREELLEALEYQTRELEVARKSASDAMEMFNLALKRRRAP